MSLIAPYAIWLHLWVAHELLVGLYPVKGSESWPGSSLNKAKLQPTSSKRLVCSILMVKSSYPRHGLPPSLPAGWLRLRPSHLPAVCQVLPGRPAALLHGGPRHRRRHLPEGVVAILRCAAATGRGHLLTAAPPLRLCPQTPSRGCQCTTKRP